MDSSFGCTCNTDTRQVTRLWIDKCEEEYYSKLMQKPSTTTYLEQHKDRFLSELLELLRIPSISTQKDHVPDMHRAAEYVAKKLEAAGAEDVAIMPTGGHPVVYGTKKVDASAPTVLVYGHYDVQPAEPLDQWVSPPFEPTIRDGKIYARGATDDKGQMYMHLKAFESMVATNALPCNLIFLIEGEEELGSPNLGRFCREHAHLLQADVALISDTSILANTIPAIETGLRGLVYIEVNVRGLAQDLHSGLYGGAVPNAAAILTRMIATLHDKKGRITIPGFYDDVAAVSRSERAAMSKRPHSDRAYAKSIGARALEGEAGFTTIERTTIRPTLEVNGIWGGYTQPGSKTIIPAETSAKLSTRLVPDQDPKKVVKALMAHLKRIAPPSVTVSVRQLDGMGKPYVMPTDHPAYRAAEVAMQATFGKKPIPTRSGGSIPVTAIFADQLGMKSVLMGFGLDSDNLHAPNEHYGLFNYYKGIETIPLFFEAYAREYQKSRPRKTR